VFRANLWNKTDIRHHIRTVTLCLQAASEDLPVPEHTYLTLTVIFAFGFFSYFSHRPRNNFVIWATLTSLYHDDNVDVDVDDDDDADCM